MSFGVYRHAQFDDRFKIQASDASQPAFLFRCRART
jgi:hypothetical protein